MSTHFFFTKFVLPEAWQYFVAFCGWKSCSLFFFFFELMAVRWRSIDNVLQKGLEIHTFIYIIFAPLAAPKKHYVIDDGLLLLLLVVQPLHWSFNELLMTLFAAAHLLCSHLRTHTQRESRTLVCCILPGAQINQHSLTLTHTHHKASMSLMPLAMA